MKICKYCSVELIVNFNWLECLFERGTHICTKCSRAKNRLWHLNNKEHVNERKRNDCEKDFYGECCEYGNDDPMEIVMSLLLDYDVPSLGHRKICLSETYNLIGVSIQPHKNYTYNSVLDFK